MIGTIGMSRFNSQAASIPFITGIERSSKIKSGRKISAISTASFPFSASPQTSKSFCESNKSQSAFRILSWSSAINTDFVILDNLHSSPPDLKAVLCDVSCLEFRRRISEQGRTAERQISGPGRNSAGAKRIRRATDAEGGKLRNRQGVVSRVSRSRYLHHSPILS